MQQLFATWEVRGKKRNIAVQFVRFAAMLRSEFQLSLPILPTFNHKLHPYSNSWIRIFFDQLSCS